MLDRLRPGHDYYSHDLGPLVSFLKTVETKPEQAPFAEFTEQFYQEHQRLLADQTSLIVTLKLEGDQLVAPTWKTPSAELLWIGFDATQAEEGCLSWQIVHEGDRYDICHVGKNTKSVRTSYTPQRQILSQRELDPISQERLQQLLVAASTHAHATAQRDRANAIFNTKTVQEGLAGLESKRILHLNNATNRYLSIGDSLLRISLRNSGKLPVVPWRKLEDFELLFS